MKLNSICLIASLLFSVTVPAYSASEFKAVMNGNMLEFDGGISNESFLVIKKHLENGAKTILIRSGGGDGEAGLAIAELLHKYEINLIVDQYCLSACANYLFVAAKEKTLPVGAILGFHGGLEGSPRLSVQLSDLPSVDGFDVDFIEHKIKPTLAIKNRHIEEVHQKGVDFFGLIGFDPALLKQSGELTRAEQVDPAKTMRCYNTDSSKNVDIKCQNIVNVNKFYFPSQATLLKYGVKGIQTYSYPKDLSALKVLNNRIAEQNYPKFSELMIVGDFE